MTTKEISYQRLMMHKKSKRAFTLVELMLALLLAGLLTSALMTLYLNTKKSYQIVMTLASLLDDEHYVMHLLKNKIENAADIEIYKNKFQSTSDTLVIQDKSQQKIAYYIAYTNWTQKGKPVLALFSKPIEGNREELSPNVVGLVIKSGDPISTRKGIDFAVIIRSSEEILKTPVPYIVYDHTITPVDRYLYRVSYGFSAIKERIKHVES